MFKTYKCVVCSKESRFKYSKLNLYCSQLCQLKKQRSDIIENWLSGGEKSVWKYSIPAWAKNYLIEQRGYACEICAISEYNNKPLMLQVDHINGDATNNFPDNLQLICPNCHSQTESYAGANRGKGRISRRKVV
jgi:hypothetical protein